VDEVTANCKVEDGLAELRDLLGAGGEAREVAEVEADVLAEGGRISGGLVQALEGRSRQPIPSFLPLRLRRLQPVAQRHQFVHFGDDAKLLGERWDRDKNLRERLLVDLWHRDAIGLLHGLVDERVRQHERK
jgi:hypothetical protein